MSYVRTLIVSDVHSNLAALDAVMKDARRMDALDAVWSAGDVVGYGPNPNDCVDRMRAFGTVGAMGNHDAAAVGRLEPNEFNPYAAAACRWTRQQLTRDSIEYLEGLELIRESAPFTIVHGTPNDPLREYLLSYPQADDAWYMTQTTGLVVGHSHLAFICEEGNGVLTPGPDGLRVAVGQRRLVVNPGSVGQPRDGDPRASYAVYDDEAGIVSLQRVEYDIASTQRSMEEAGLPEPLVSRLSLGR